MKKNDSANAKKYKNEHKTNQQQMRMRKKCTPCWEEDYS